MVNQGVNMLNNNGCFVLVLNEESPLIMNSKKSKAFILFKETCNPYWI